MKAVILAAGEGTRLEPLTNVRPKPMIPVGNRPILEWVVDAVAASGIDEAIVVVGYKRERIQNHFGDGDDWGVDVTYAVQDKQLGTGDAILRAEPHVGDDFVVLNGDRVIEPDLVERVLSKRARTGDWIVSVTRFDEAGLYGVVEVEGEQVVDLVEKPPAHEVDSELVNAGVYAFGSDVFDAIRGTETNGDLEITATLRRSLATRSIEAVPYDGPWLDVTRPWDLLAVNGQVLDREPRRRADTARVDDGATVADAVNVGADATIHPGAAVLRGTAIGENVTVGPNAVVRNSVLLADATVGPGAVVTDCIVGANATIGPNTTVEGGDTAVVLGDRVHRDVRFGGLLGDNARLGAGVTVAPGTVVGDGAVIDSGATVRGRIAPDVHVVRE